VSYDWPREADWQRGWMLGASGGRAPWGRELASYAPWNFIHVVEDCRWSDCEFHHPEDVTT
jgi:hypothetical protein